MVIHVADNDITFPEGLDEYIVTFIQLVKVYKKFGDGPFPHILVIFITMLWSILGLALIILFLEKWVKLFK